MKKFPMVLLWGVLLVLPFLALSAFWTAYWNTTRAKKEVDQSLADTKRITTIFPLDKRGGIDARAYIEKIFAQDVERIVVTRKSFIPTKDTPPFRMLLVQNGEEFVILKKQQYDLIRHRIRVKVILPPMEEDTLITQKDRKVDFYFPMDKERHEFSFYGIWKPEKKFWHFSYLGNILFEKDTQDYFEGLFSE